MLNTHIYYLSVITTIPTRICGNREPGSQVGTLHVRACILATRNKGEGSQTYPYSISITSDLLFCIPVPRSGRDRLA